MVTVSVTTWEGCNLRNGCCCSSSSNLVESVSDEDSTLSLTTLCTIIFGRLSQYRAYSGPKRQPRLSTRSTVPTHSAHKPGTRQAELGVGGTTLSNGTQTHNAPLTDRCPSQWRNPRQIMHLFSSSPPTTRTPSPDSRAADRCGSASAHVGCPRPVRSRPGKVSPPPTSCLSFPATRNERKGHRSLYPGITTSPTEPSAP